MSDSIYEDYFQRIAKTLLEATKDCRESMHEPDEQELTARLDGKDFDNTGIADEMHIVLWKVDQNIETRYNLASLIALARLGAKQVIERAKEEAPKPGSVAEFRKWLEVRNGDDSLAFRETLETTTRLYTLRPLPPIGTVIYIDRDHTTDKKRKPRS